MQTTASKKILIVSANPLEDDPRDTVHLALDKEIRTIEEARKLSRYRDQFEIKTLLSATVQDLQRELLEFEPRIVHFSGHGNVDTIEFADADNRNHTVKGDAIIHLLSLAAGYLECVVLNACWSETLAEGIRQHISYAIGMEKSIGDAAAIEFSRGFYTAFFAGKFYPMAHEQGCAAIRLMDIPEYLTPKIKIKEIDPVRQNFVLNYRTDIGILCAEAHRDWTDELMDRLDDLMAQRMGVRNAYTWRFIHDVDNPGAAAAEAATLLVVHSSALEASSAFQDGLNGFLSKTGDGKRVFLLEGEALYRSDSLQKSLSYRFWRHDDCGDTCLLASGEELYNIQLNMLAQELEKKLTALKQEAEHRIKLNRKREESKARWENRKMECADLPDALLFINAAPEDRPLLAEIQQFMDENEVPYSLPLESEGNPSPADVRKDLENNIKACDLFIVLHGRSSVPWVREQLLYGRRMGRFRKENPLRLMVLHDQTDIKGKVEAPLNISNWKNLKVYKCPPSHMAEYLPECIKAVCPEEIREAADV